MICNKYPLISTLIVSCLLGASLRSEETDPAILKNLDIFELEVAVDPQISPDGSQVTYVRRSYDIMTDKSLSNIWVVSTDGERHRPLLSGAKSFSSPRWSPAGDRLAYVSSVGDRGSELHIRWMDTGQTALLSNLEKSPGALAWSPDGKQIAFSMLVPAEGPKLAKPPKKPKGAEWAPEIKVIDKLYYRADGRGYLEAGYNHVFVIPSEGGTPRQLTKGNYNHRGPLSWSPDGSTILFSANRNDDWEYNVRESEVWAVNLGSGELSLLTDRTGPDSSPIFSPDGSKIVYRGFDDVEMEYENTRVYVMDADGENQQVLTDSFDRGVDAVSWARRFGAADRSIR